MFYEAFVCIKPCSLIEEFNKLNTKTQNIADMKVISQTIRDNINLRDKTLRIYNLSETFVKDCAH